MEKEYVCQYCGEIVNKDEAVHNGRWATIEEEVWRPKCYEKEHEYARNKGGL